MKRNVDDILIPPDIQAMLEEKPPTPNQLDAIGKALESRKKEAITYRQTCGIEDVWAACEDAYNGIDDANRAEFGGNRMIKATAMNVPLTTNASSKDRAPARATAFVRLTSRYVDAGAAKVGEILLPINDKAFSFTETPNPTLLKGLEDMSQVVENGQAMMRMARPEEMAQMGQAPRPGTPPMQVPLTTKDLAEEQIAKARAAAKKAEKIIYDWMVECQHHREMRKVIFDSARIGVGVLKGPFPDRRRRMAMVKDNNGKLTLEIRDQIVPVDKWVSAWNIYPDPACGENIRNGDSIWERDHFSEKQVRKLKGLPGYIDEQIDKALAAGPTRTVTASHNPNELDAKEKHPYEVWFYHGTMKREDFAVINPTTAKDIPSDRAQVYAVVTMIGEIVVHATINPLDSGEFPYHAVPWLRRPGFWAGVGVAEQLFVPQRMVNSATRAMLNNAGISAGPQIVINKKLIEPAIEGDYSITPNKVWYMTEDGITDDVRKAFLSFDIQNVVDRLMKIIEYGMRLAEESTNIPLITQGLSGRTTPETYGAAQLQDNNANQLLRAIGYSFDDYITEPLVNQYYEYLLLDPDVDADAKGDFSINAHGSIAMIERSIQDQTIAQMTPLAQNPMFGVDPKRWFAVLAKSKHLDPAEFQYTKEEQEKIDSAPKPQAPAVEVAKIKAATAQQQMALDQQRAQEEDALARELAQLDVQSAQAIEALRNETAQLRVKLDTDRDTVYVQTEASRAQAEFTRKMEELKLKRELAIMEYASKNQQTLEQVKARLAETALKLQTQKELAAMETKLEIHKQSGKSAKDAMKPPTQTPGKAGQGKAFTQV